MPTIASASTSHELASLSLEQLAPVDCSSQHAGRHHAAAAPRQHLLSTIADERGLISKIRARHGTRNELSFNRLTDGDSARAKPRP